MTTTDRDRMARRFRSRAVHLATAGTARDIDTTEENGS